MGEWFRFQGFPVKNNCFSGLILDAGGDILPSQSSQQTLMNNTREYAVGWFTLSLINAGLAQLKGRSGLGWWFASLFFGPICTFLIVVLDPEKPKP
jgi:hypothetical protein